MRQWLKDYGGILVVVAVAVAFVVVLAVLTACDPTPVPPPIVPKPPPVQPISQCGQALPDTYTRPAMTNHPWELRTSLPGQRVIRWLSRHCDKWIQGPYDPSKPELFCTFHPELGDLYWSERDTFVAPIPLPCPYSV